MDFDFGKEPANTFSRDQHPDLRADYIMANPPFNMKEWNVGVKDDDPRWKYGIPPTGNANFAWMQHMIHHLAPHGSMWSWSCPDLTDTLAFDKGVRNAQSQAPLCSSVPPTNR
jgi:hypothetical protein